MNRRDFLKLAAVAVLTPTVALADQMEPPPVWWPEKGGLSVDGWLRSHGTTYSNMLEEAAVKCAGIVGVPYPVNAELDACVKRCAEPLVVFMIVDGIERDLFQYAVRNHRQLPRHIGSATTMMESIERQCSFIISAGSESLEKEQG